MKKKAKNFLLVLTITLACIISTVFISFAADYPIAYPKNYNMEATVGDVVNIEFTYFRAFKSEILEVNIYDENGNRVATSERSFSSSGSSTIDYTLEWDTEDEKPGKYKVVASTYFYSYYDWHQSPRETVCYITLSCKHSYENTVTSATLTKDGSIVQKCKSCGQEGLITSIPHIKTIELSNTSYKYNGKVQKPTVTVKDTAGKKLSEGEDYIVKYSDVSSKDVGEYKVTVTFKGNYSGKKELKYSIKTDGVTGLKVKKLTTTSITLNWKKMNGAKNYIVYQSTNGKKWIKVATVEKNSVTIKNLTAGNKYSYKVVAKTKKGKTNDSEVLKTATLTNAPKITVKSTTGETVNVSWGKVAGAKKYVIYKSKDNKNWVKATESKKTSAKLTNLKGGSTIYIKVAAYNAYGKVGTKSKVVSVTVKKSVLSVSKTAVSVKTGKKTSVTVTMRKNASVYWNTSNSDIVTCKWSKKWDGDNTTLYIIGGNKPGTAYITISNDYNKEVKKIKVTVKDSTNVKIEMPETPVIINTYDWNDEIEQTVKVTKGYYTAEKDSYDGTYDIKISFDGIKTFDSEGKNHSSYAEIGWKLYKKGTKTVVDSGTIYSTGMAVNENFEDAHDYIYNLKPGEYTLVILSSSAT